MGWGWNAGMKLTEVGVSGYGKVGLRWGVGREG